MFNNRSTGSERHNLLKSILRADDQEEEEENEAPDDETINQMIARYNNWKTKKSQPMRNNVPFITKVWRRVWKVSNDGHRQTSSRGCTWVRKKAKANRRVRTSSILDSGSNRFLFLICSLNFNVRFLQDEFEVEEEEIKEIELGRGNRMRKETNYDDQLSERDWLKAIGVIKFGIFMQMAT